METNSIDHLRSILGYLKTRPPRGQKVREKDFSNVLQGVPNRQTHSLCKVAKPSDRNCLNQWMFRMAEWMVKFLKFYASQGKKVPVEAYEGVYKT